MNFRTNVFNNLFNPNSQINLRNSEYDAIDFDFSNVIIKNSY